MNANEFDAHAERTLHVLLAAVDEVDEIEAELSQGVLTISFGQGNPFVVNSHRAAGQIWMAAERTAWHFSPDETFSRWTSTKPPHEDLRSALADALTRKLGRPVEIAV